MSPHELLSKANEITKDTHSSTNIYVEGQTIDYITNPSRFKEDLGKAKQEIKDIGRAVKESINDRGDDNRNFFGQLSEGRLRTTVNNIAGKRLSKAEDRHEIGKAFEDAYKDLGYKAQVIYTDPKNAPQLIDEKGKAKSGTAYVDKEGIHTILINVEDPKNSTRSGLIGTISEEGSHIIGKVEGRQLKTGTEEKGLESTGRATNEYFTDKYKKNDISIETKSDGKDYSNVDFGEDVGSACIATLNGCLKDRGHLSRLNPLEFIEKKVETIEKNMSYIKKNEDKYMNIIKNKGKKKALEEMEVNVFDNLNDNWAGPFGKKLFSIYGASDKVRKQYLVPIEKTGEDTFYEKRPWNTEKLYLDDVMPDEMYRLFNRKESTSLVNSAVINYWNKKIKNKQKAELSYDKRNGERKIIDFTLSNSEFTALGHTNLYTSTYGKVEKVKTSKGVEYKTNITVLIQYKDTFDEVKNIFESGQKVKDRKELNGGKPFGIETRKKEIKINKTLNSLSEIENEIKKALQRR